MTSERDLDRCPDDSVSPRFHTDGGGMGPRLPALPPPDETPTRILALSGAAVSSFHRQTISAMVDELGPDVLVATEPRATIVGPAVGREFDPDVLEVGAGMRPDVATTDDDRGIVIALPMGEHTLDPERVATRVGTSTFEGDPGDQATPPSVCLITQTVSLSVDPYARSATLDGVSRYRDRVPDQWWVPRTVHLSTALRAGFTTTGGHGTGGEAEFVGIGTSNADLGVGTRPDTNHATLVALYSNGAVDVSEIDPQAFGLRGVHGIGPTRHEALRDAGINTVDALADAPLRRLTDLPGLGRTSANTIRTAAKARSTETVISTATDSLPGREPVFIDIETDGLEPSTAWLVGVLDGGPEDGHYMPFTERAPDDGSHLEAFLAWAEANAANRPLVAWNGYSFDFPVVRDIVRKHCPERLPMWDDAYQFDPLWWARDKNGGNAALPGRSNELEAVAEALGWEPQTTGIDGSVVAKRYSAYRREWLADGADGPVDEPDWDRLEAYCEDDVRALATIYEALTDASRREPGADTRSGTETSTQGALSDFS